MNNNTNNKYINIDAEKEEDEGEEEEEEDESERNWEKGKTADVDDAGVGWGGIWEPEPDAALGDLA